MPEKLARAKALSSSSIFLTVMSRNAINHKELDSNNFARLTEDSPCDEVLLEYRLALEFQTRGLVDNIYPVMVGDVVESREGVEPKYNNYFGAGCHPGPLLDKEVQSVELECESLLADLYLGSSMRQGMTVKAMMQQITKNQGKLFEGSRNVAIKAVLDDVMAMKQNHNS